VGKILAVGRNYAAHAAEMKAAAGGPPLLFLKPPTAIVHDGANIRIPEGAGSVHHEVELVAVIGRRSKALEPRSALEHVLGYAVGLDLTLRDVQAQAKREGAPWSLSKGFDGSAPLSRVVPAEQIGDGSGLAVTLDVNGERRQTGNTSDMLHSVADLVAYASRWMTLERGDLLFTGTPAGVGPVVPGDRLHARIDRVGELHVEIAGTED
jgi:2-keto-4-pentenoate hydratase/2-oxohepta-3-ene-1,7-dioic acid hydratase in catechol pathway